MTIWTPGINLNQAQWGYLDEEYKDRGFDSKNWNFYRGIHSRIFNFIHNFTGDAE